MKVGVFCGTTKSGKKVYSITVSDYENGFKGLHPLFESFSTEDNFDAYAIFSYLASRARLNLRSIEGGALQYQANRCLAGLDLEVSKNIKVEQGIVTVFDLMVYGKGLIEG